MTEGDLFNLQVCKLGEQEAVVCRVKYFGEILSDDNNCPPFVKPSGSHFFSKQESCLDKAAGEQAMLFFFWCGKLGQVKDHLVL